MNSSEPSTPRGTQKQLNLLLLYGGLILFFFHLVLRQALPSGGFLGSYWFMGIALLIGGFGLRGFIFGKRSDWVSKCVENSAHYLYLSPVQIAALSLAVLFSITCTLAAGFSGRMIHPFVSLVSWAAAIGLVVFAGWERKPVPLLTFKVLATTLFLLFITAFLLRGLNLTVYPSVLSGDEGAMGLSSVFFLSGLTDNIFITGWYSFPAMYYFVQSFGIALLGQTTIGLRITAALVGSVTVAVLFLVMRSMFNTRSALIAALLLAFSSFHIHFSRLGLNNIWDGLSWLLTLGSLWWAWNHERRAAYVAAGLFLGLSQYFYVSARGLFAAVPLWLLIVSILDPNRLRRSISGIFIMGISMLVMFLPLAWFYVCNPVEFQAPLQRVTILGGWVADEMARTGQGMAEILIAQFTGSLSGLTVAPFQNAWFDSGYPLLRPFSGLLFYLGAGLLLFRWKDNRLSLIVVWLTVIIVTGALSTNPPAPQRYVAAAPLCYMVIGYGLDGAIRFVEQSIQRWRRLIAFMSIVVVLIIGFEEAGFYFYDYSPRAGFGGYPTRVAQKLADHLQEYDDSWEVFFVGWPRMGYRSILSTVYLAPHISATDINNPWGDPTNPVPDGDKLLFVFLPQRQADLDLCMQQYPGGELISVHGLQEMLFYMYRLQPAQ